MSTRYTDAQIMRAAHIAQGSAIRGSLITRYIGDASKIGEWTDFAFHLSSFSAGTVAYYLGPKTYAVARARLAKLASAGHLTRMPGRHLSYRLSRAECDQLAPRMLDYWKACGYSTAEALPNNKSREAEVLAAMEKDGL